MKINGLNFLNNNWYDSIMIREREGKIEIDVKAKKKTKTIESENKFYNNIKKLPEKEKISEIIRYFLRNNKINYLSDKHIDNYSGKFMIVSGTRDLYLQISKDKVEPSIVNEIKEKYRRDREEFIYNNNIKNIYIGSAICSDYFIAEDDFHSRLEPYLSLTLLKKNDEILDFEKDFLTKFLTDKFKETNELINCGFYALYSGNIGYLNFEEWPGLYFKSDKFIIRIDENLYRIALDIALEHNYDIKNTRKLQLSIKDF